MVTVYTFKRSHFRDSFRAASDNIAKGLSTIRSAASDGHWANWAALCRDLYLEPLPILYKEPVPILKDFA